MSLALFSALLITGSMLMLLALAYYFEFKNHRDDAEREQRKQRRLNDIAADLVTPAVQP